MDILQKIIQLMSREEVKMYTILAGRSGKEEDRKDQELFKIFRRGKGELNERKLARKFYGPGGDNTYYRLKNRLFNEVNKSLVLLHWEESTERIVLHQLSLALQFRERGEFEVAWHYLRKAERKAHEAGLPEWLDKIYAIMISLSMEITDIDPAEYIRLRDENSRTLNRLRDIDNVLAVVSHRLKLSQNLGAGDTGVADLLGRTVEEFSSDEAVRESALFRFRLYEAVSKVLLSKRDYIALEQFLRTTLAEFEHKNWFTRNNHETKLQMITYLVNCLFKNGKTRESLEFAEQLHTEMERFGRLFYDKYLIFYHSALANNYSILDPDRSIEILEEILKDDRFAKSPIYHQLIYLNLALSYYRKGNYKKAIQHLVKLYLQEAFSAMDDGLKLKVIILEMVLRYELAEPEVLQYRLSQVRHDFGELLQQPEWARENELLTIILKMSESPEPGKDKELRAAVEAFRGEYREEDTHVVNYVDWLQKHFT